MTQSSRVLATRCPHCHTVFRVVADQLKLRDGLVRCGHCREVFDGRVYLCEPPGEATDATAAEPISATHTTHADDMPQPHAGTANDVAESDLTGEPKASSVSFDTAVPAATAPASASTSTQANDAASAASVASVASAASSTSSATSSASAEKPPVPEMLTPTAIAALLGTADESRAQMLHGPGRYIDDDDSTALTAPTASTPRVEPPASSGLAGRSQRPGAGRVVWRVLLTLAILGLIAQWAWIERAAVVDRVPALRGVFAALGRPMHVRIAPPRQPDMIQISSVTLVTDEVGTTDATDATNAANTAADATASAASAGNASTPPGDAVPMTLTVFIRNQADYPVAWPSLELTLSDIDGKPVVRRVFAASDYVTDATLREAGLASRNERTIRLRLSAQAALASNYRVLAFYP